MAELSNVVIDGKQLDEDKKSEEKNIITPELQRRPSENEELHRENNIFTELKQDEYVVASLKQNYQYENLTIFLENLPKYLIFSLWIFLNVMIWKTDIACYFPENTLLGIGLNGIIPFCKKMCYLI